MSHTSQRAATQAGQIAPFRLAVAPLVFLSVVVAMPTIGGGIEIPAQPVPIVMPHDQTSRTS